MNHSEYTVVICGICGDEVPQNTLIGTPRSCPKHVVVYYDKYLQVVDYQDAALVYPYC